MSLISAPKVRPENQPPLSDPKQVSRLEPQTRKPAPKKLWKTLKNFEYPDFIINQGGYISGCSLHRIIYSLSRGFLMTITPREPYLSIKV